MDFINFQSNVLYENYNGDDDKLEQDLIDQMPMLKLSNTLFLQESEFNFRMLGESIGIPPTYSNGSAVSDLDNDGDLDLVSNNINEEAQILENQSNNLNNSFIKLNIKNKNGSPSLGAKVIVHFDGKTLKKEINNSRGFASTSSSIVQFGLANNKNLDSLEVKWLDGTSNKFYDLDSNQIHKISHQYSNLISDSNKDSDLFELEEIDFKHSENNYLDYEREPLMPERLSIEGPAYVSSDFNGDGFKDIFIGGAKLQSPKLLIQTSDGLFNEVNNLAFSQDSQFEDVDAAAFDFDQDGDMDIYVMSGGNEYIDGDPNLMDRLYINNGNAVFKSFQQIYQAQMEVQFHQLISIMMAIQIYLLVVDLFQEVMDCPHSIIVKSTPDTDSYFEVVAQSPLGMVTDSKYADINNDGIMDSGCNW